MATVRHRLAQERGLTLIEVLVAAFVLTVGIMGVVYSFEGSRKLTLTAERRASLVHRAQREIERLEAVSYGELAMVSAPEHSTEEANPDHYVDFNSPIKCKEVEKGGCYAWNSENLAQEGPLVIAEAKTEGKSCSEDPVTGCGEVSASPSAWNDGNVSGKMYAFVTWQTDGSSTKPYCGEGCPKENDYKRITVILTVNVPTGTHAITPVRVSTLIANPNAAGGEGTAKNPLTSPGTICGGKLCTAAISANARSWSLHDSSAQGDEETGKVASPTANHETHPTVAPLKSTSCEASNHSGCPRPDLMDEGTPTTTTLYDYSTDQDASGYTFTLASGLPSTEPFTEGYGGRRLETIGGTCETQPTESEANANFKSEMWVTKPVSAETTLTGAGGLSIYTQTVAGIAGAGTLCLAIYDVPKPIDGLWLTPEATPTLVGYTNYATTEWPTSLQSLSFTFEPGGTRQLLNAKREAVKEAKIAAEHRIGLRIWAAAAPADGLAIAYDTGPETKTEKPGYPALLQLNTE